MYDLIIKCLAFKLETKPFSIEAARPSALAHLTCFLDYVWYYVACDCVRILLDGGRKNTTKHVYSPILGYSSQTGPFQSCWKDHG